MKTVSWKLHLKSNPKTVFELLTTDEGRASFWAEKAAEYEGIIRFRFPNGQHYDGCILKRNPYHEFQLDYFNSIVEFQMESAENEGTELLLINQNLPENDFAEVSAGWVSVLMNLKAVADFQCDLRNHNTNKTWDEGYANN